MSRGTYQLRLDTYAALGYKLVHLDSYRDDGDTWFAGIWTKNADAAPEVRSDRPWYKFLRSYNNARCNGREIDNFYVTAIEGTLQYGGIFRRSSTPMPTIGSPFAQRLAQEVDCAPGRAGAAVIDVTANRETSVSGRRTTAPRARSRARSSTRCCAASTRPRPTTSRSTPSSTRACSTARTRATA